MNANEIDVNKYLQNPLLLQLEKLTGVSPVDVPIDDEKVYSLLTDPKALGVFPNEIGCVTGTLGIPELDNPFMHRLLLLTRASSFEDLIKAFGLAHGAGTWNDNAEHLLKSGECMLSEVIANREDVLEFLQEKGIGHEQALTIMTQVRKGRVHKKGFSPGDENLLREHGVPDWYIDSCKKIEYLLPKAQTLQKLNVSVRLLWFKLYHPLAFYAATFLAADRAISECRENLQHEIRQLEQKENKTGDEELTLEAYCCAADGSAELEQLKNEYRCRGFDFLPVELGKSLAVEYKIEDGGLRLPYISIEGIGINFAYRLEEKAEPKENYTSYRDVNKKIGLNMVVMDALEQAGLLTGMSTGTKHLG